MSCFLKHAAFVVDVFVLMKSYQTNEQGVFHLFLAPQTSHFGFDHPGVLNDVLTTTPAAVATVIALGLAQDTLHQLDLIWCTQQQFAFVCLPSDAKRAKN